jgi:hypothetical protein
MKLYSMGLRLATLMGLEPTTSCVTGTFGLISLLSVGVYKRPSLWGLPSIVHSADVARCPPMYAHYATPRLPHRCLIRRPDVAP